MPIRSSMLGFANIRCGTILLKMDTQSLLTFCTGYPPTTPFPRLPAGRLLVSSPEPVPLHVLRWEGCREGPCVGSSCFPYEPCAINHVLAEQEVRIEQYA